MILVDTSVWIDFFRANDLPHVQILERMIENGEHIVLCGVILTEILKGIHDESTANRHAGTALISGSLPVTGEGSSTTTKRGTSL